MSITRPARANPILSLRCSIEVEPGALGPHHDVDGLTNHVGVFSLELVVGAAGRLGGLEHALFVVGAPLAGAHDLDDGMDLFLGNPRPLDPLRLRVAGGHHDHVAEADGLLGAGEVENHAVGL